MAYTRLTENKEGSPVVSKEYIQEDSSGFRGEAVDRLAKFEDVYDRLLISQENLSQKLEELQQQGKTQSHQFKETMGKKLMNSMIISLLESRGLR